MRRLIITNTHYQTIVAIQLKYTLFKSDDVVLLISDHSKGSDKIVEALKEKNIFEDVRYIFTRKLLYEYTKTDAWRDFVSFSFLDDNRYSFYFSEIKNLRFDELLVFNYEADIYGLYAILYKYNQAVKISMFEEGMLSYQNEETTSKKLKTSCDMRHKLHKKDIYDATGNFYCFYPSFYQGRYAPVQIPLINSGSDCVKVLKDIFGLDESKLNYKEKYIFFTSVYDFEGGAPIGEFETVKYISELVGKDNLLVKIHPRDRRTIFEDNGMKIDKNSAIPWEVIQLSIDFSDKVFLTATSGSLLSGNAMTDNPVKSLYLFELCNYSNNANAKRTINELRKLLGNTMLKEHFKTVDVVEKKDDLVWMKRKNI